MKILYRNMESGLCWRNLRDRLSRILGWFRGLGLPSSLELPNADNVVVDRAVEIDALLQLTRLEVDAAFEEDAGRSWS